MSAKKQPGGIYPSVNYLILGVADRLEHRNMLRFMVRMQCRIDLRLFDQYAYPELLRLTLYT